MTDLVGKIIDRINSLKGTPIVTREVVKDIATKLNVKVDKSIIDKVLTQFGVNPAMENARLPLLEKYLGGINEAAEKGSLNLKGKYGIYSPSLKQFISSNGLQRGEFTDDLTNIKTYDTEQVAKNMVKGHKDKWDDGNDAIAVTLDITIKFKGL